MTLEKIELANKETVRRILQGEPVLIDVQPAGEVIKGLAKNMAAVAAETPSSNVGATPPT